MIDFMRRRFARVEPGQRVRVARPASDSPYTRGQVLTVEGTWPGIGVPVIDDEEMICVVARYRLEPVD